MSYQPSSRTQIEFRHHAAASCAPQGKGRPTRRRVSAPLWGLLLLSAACTADVRNTREVAGTESALFVDPSPTMAILAHEDDDYFPDVIRTMKQTSGTYYIVVLTSGDAGFVCGSRAAGTCDDSYIVSREHGQMAALAQISGVSFNAAHPELVWNPEWKTLANGMSVRKLSLNNNRVHLIYLGLANDETEALSQLWNATSTAVQVSTLPCDTRRPSQSTYTRDRLVETLRLLMAEYQPKYLHTMDSSRIWPETGYPSEHPDHVAGALFALTASQKYVTPHTFRLYRTYNIMFEQENVAEVDAAPARTALATYASYDAWFPNASNNNCPTGFVTMCDNQTVPCEDPALWSGLEYMQYTIAPVHGKGITGGIRSPLGSCVRVSNAVAGTAVTLADCSFGSAGQEWVIGTDGTIRPSAASTLCVTAAGAHTAYRPRNIALTLSACAASTAAAAFSQQFSLMSNGQLRGPDATCIAASGTSLTTAECADVSNQEGFRPQFFPHPVTAATTGYTEATAEIPNRYDIYHTLSYADLDATTPKLADVCVRRAAGVYCSKSTGTAFGAPVQFTSDFRDATGWSGDAYGSTVQLADVNNDKKADVCGRRWDGIYCALGTGTSFGSATLWSGDFNDLYGYADSSGYYGSLHFPDVNADGFADVCARNGSGIECALNKGGTLKAFYPVAQWTSAEFSDQLFWNDDAHGSTVQFADVDGDRYVDVCGRAADGIICALNDRSGHFNAQHMWSAGDDFSDDAGWGAARSRYGSIHFADLNGDGMADVCGRSSAGLVCGISLGASFAEAKLMLPLNPFDDASNWSPDRFGATLALADIDGDGHADVCGRGPIPGGSSIGLRCAFSP